MDKTESILIDLGHALGTLRSEGFIDMKELMTHDSAVTKARREGTGWKFKFKLLNKIAEEAGYEVRYRTPSDLIRPLGRDTQLILNKCKTTPKAYKSIW